MTPSVDTLFSAALTLPAESRAALAERLLESLDDPGQAEIDAAWVAEVNKRLAQLERGEAKTIPADEVFRSLRIRNRS